MGGCGRRARAESPKFLCKGSSHFVVEEIPLQSSLLAQVICVLAQRLTVGLPALSSPSQNGLRLG